MEGGYEIAIARARRGGGDARAFRNGGRLSDLSGERAALPAAGAQSALHLDQLLRRRQLGWEVGQYIGRSDRPLHLCPTRRLPSIATRASARSSAADSSAAIFRSARGCLVSKAISMRSIWTPREILASCLRRSVLLSRSLFLFPPSTS